MKKIILTFLPLLFLVSCSNNDQQTLDNTIYDKPLTDIQSNRLNFVLDSVCNQMQIKGVSSSVFIPNKGLWEGTYGFSHSNIPINSNMAMTIGSNTKTYIASLILRLQENGIININDKVSDYLTDVPFLDNNVTIKQLLNHTTGFGDFTFNPDFINALILDFNRVWQPIETFPYFESPTGISGTYSYSDQNYLIAGLVIESATNKSVKANMRELILNPAGLRKTVYYPFEQTNLTIPHSWSADFGTSFRDLDEEGYSRIAFCSADNAAGGMLSTSKENLIFWDKLMTGKIISQTSLNQLLSFIQTPTNENLYGLGIQKIVNRFNNSDIYSHSGYVPGSVNDNAYDPATGICITVLTNQDLILDFDPILSALHKEALKIN